MWFLLVFLVGCFAQSQVNATTPTEFNIDTAKLALVWTGQGSLTVFGRNGECHQCIPYPLATFEGLNRSIVYVVAPTSHGFYLSTSSHTPEVWFDLGDRGVYECQLDDSGYVTVTEVTPPFNTWLPIVVALFVYIGLAVVFLLGYKCIYPMCVAKKSKSEETSSLLVNQEATDAAEARPAASAIPRSGQRLYSIDTFRGCCLAVMVFVNYGGGRYWFFNHSLWDGLTVADLVFPWFVFLMGVSISLSLSSIMSRPFSWVSMLYKIFRRAAILFALGLVVNNCYVVEQCRVPGVLQRFAVSYLVCTMIVLFVPRLSCRFDNHAFTGAYSIYVDRILEWVIVALLVLTWCLITFLLPVPGCPTGYIGPGGLSLGPELAACTGGAARYIDLLVFGEAHIYQTPTAQVVYNTLSYDPEGLLGCLTSIFICYLGVHCGRLFVAYRKTSPNRMLVHLGLEGAFLATVGAGLAGFSQYDGVIPIAKNLWSLSFVLVMAGTGFLACLVFFVVVDLRLLWTGSPFRQLGINSIFIYVCHEVLGSTFPWQWQLAENATHGAALFKSLTGCTIWVTTAMYCYWIDFRVVI